MKIQESKILIVPKMSKYEYDMHRWNLNTGEVLDRYKQYGLDVSRIIDSHYRQKESLEQLVNYFSNIELIARDGLTRDICKRYSLIIAFGGDNHFQYVSHFLDDTPILGLNSDPVRSEGALTSASISDLDKILDSLKNPNYEEWTRLEASLNGRTLQDYAISEIFVGEEKRFNMSRHIIEVNGRKEEQKGSGLLIATGIGSTGWYNSASRYFYSEGNVFPKTDRKARFILTEPYNGRLSTHQLLSGEIKDDEVLRITSLSDSQPYLSLDSLKLIPLIEGSKIIIKIGEPLRVLKI